MHRLYICFDLPSEASVVYHTSTHMFFHQGTWPRTVEWASWIVEGWGETAWKGIKGLHSEIPPPPPPLLEGPVSPKSVCEKCWVGSYRETQGSPHTMSLPQSAVPSHMSVLLLGLHKYLEKKPLKFYSLKLIIHKALFFTSVVNP